MFDRAPLERPTPQLSVVRALVRSERLESFIEFYGFEALAPCECTLGKRSERGWELDVSEFCLFKGANAYLLEAFWKVYLHEIDAIKEH